MNTQEQYQQTDELSFKDLILKVIDIWNELWKHKLLIILTGLLFGLGLGLKNRGAKKVYQADLSFMLNEEQKGGLSFGGMLGQFGLGDLGGESNLEKILELSKTRKITQNAIFQKATIRGRSDFLANHIIENQDTLELWQRKKWYKFTATNPAMDIRKFRFTQDSVEAFSKKENKALKAVYSIIVGNENRAGILKSSYNEMTGIMEMAVNTTDQELSVALANKLFSTLSKYYIDKTVAKQDITYKIITEKADSIGSALAYYENELADFKDKNRGLFKNKDMVAEARLMREVQKLNIMYGEATKNKELADFTLKNKTPYIQIIDAPIIPLKGTKKSMLKFLIIGGFLGGFLASAFVIARKVIRDALEE